MKWLKKKIVILKCHLLLFFATTDHFWIGLWRGEKWNLYDSQWQTTSSVVGPGSSSKPLPKAKWKVQVKSLSRVRLFATPWSVAHQAPPSMGFSRQEYWSGLPFPSPGDLPDPGIEPRSPTLQADALTSEPPGKPHPKAKLVPKKRSLVVCCWTDPLQLSESQQNHCIWVCSANRWDALKSPFCRDNFLQGKCFRSQQDAENVFQEFVESCSMDFYITGRSKHFLLAKMCWL